MKESNTSEGVRCIASDQDGQRCRFMATKHALICGVHGGARRALLDPIVRPTAQSDEIEPPHAL